MTLVGMDHHSTSKAPVTLLGLGDMGIALARAWLAAEHPLTVWNRTPAKAAALAGEGARTVVTASEAVAAATGPVVVCLLDDASVGEVLDGADLAGKDIVNLTTGTPDQARKRARWAGERGARLLDGGTGGPGPRRGPGGDGDAARHRVRSGPTAPPRRRF